MCGKIRSFTSISLRCVREYTGSLRCPDLLPCAFSMLEHLPDRLSPVAIKVSASSPMQSECSDGSPGSVRPYGPHVSAVLGPACSGTGVPDYLSASEGCLESGAAELPDSSRAVGQKNSSSDRTATRVDPMTANDGQRAGRHRKLGRRSEAVVSTPIIVRSGPGQTP